MSCEATAPREPLNAPSAWLEFRKHDNLTALPGRVFNRNDIQLLSVHLEPLGDGQRPVAHSDPP